MVATPPLDESMVEEILSAFAASQIPLSAGLLTKISQLSGQPESVLHARIDHLADFNSRDVSPPPIIG